MSPGGVVLPAGLQRSFHVAAGELGMCSAAWLFVETMRAAGGDAAVEALAQGLGGLFPVLGHVADHACNGGAFHPPEPGRLLHALAECSTVVVVGVESRWLDVLVSTTPFRRVVLVEEGLPGVDWRRVAANLEDRVELVPLGEVQRFAGIRSALLTFVYGVTPAHARVLPAWLRIMGPDVRTQFRELVGWDVLGVPMDRFPRFLTDADPADFTALVPSWP